MNLHTLTFRSLAAIALVFAGNVSASALEPFKAQYQASYMGLQANGSMTLSKDTDNRWRYDLGISHAVANMTQSTVFDEHGGHLRPLVSDDRSQVAIRKRASQGTYDWNTKRAVWTGDLRPDRLGPIELKTGDMDALLINLALARDVSKDSGKTSHSYRMVDTGRIKQMTYRVQGQEDITIAGTKHKATRLSAMDGKKEYVVWVVPGMMTPARILQRDDGSDTVDLRLVAIN